jgi:hypothetical protein
MMGEPVLYGLAVQYGTALSGATQAISSMRTLGCGSGIQGSTESKRRIK